MAEETTEVKKPAKDKFYILVPKVGAQVPNIQIIAYQEMAKTENGVQVCGEITKILSPNGQGLFMIAGSAPDHDRCVTALELYAKKQNVEGRPPVLIGPFPTSAKAFEAMHKVRPKTDAERANESASLVTTLKAENASKDETINAQRAELEALREKVAKAGK